MRPEFTPVKQKLTCIKTERNMKINEELVKQLDVGFLEVTDNSKWLANIVLVPKKDGKIRLCISYRDLNKASLKDYFSYKTMMSSWTIPSSICYLFHGWLLRL